MAQSQVKQTFKMPLAERNLRQCWHLLGKCRYSTVCVEETCISFLCPSLSCDDFVQTLRIGRSKTQSVGSLLLTRRGYTGGWQRWCEGAGGSWGSRTTPSRCPPACSPSGFDPAGCSQCPHSRHLLVGAFFRGGHRCDERKTLTQRLKMVCLRFSYPSTEAAGNWCKNLCCPRSPLSGDKNSRANKTLTNCKDRTNRAERNTNIERMQEEINQRHKYTEEHTDFADKSFAFRAVVHTLH